MMNSYLQQCNRYIKEFSHDYRVASIAPSSKSTIRAVTHSIDFMRARRIVEYGPGTGAFTRFLLDHMRSDASLVAVESNRNFVSELRSIADPRLTVLEGSVLQLLPLLTNRGEPDTNHIISGIPCSFLSNMELGTLMSASAQLLSNNGSLIIYQALTAPSGAFRLATCLHKIFLEVQFSVSLFNLPPLYLIKASRPIRGWRQLTEWSTATLPGTSEDFRPSLAS